MNRSVLVASQPLTQSPIKVIWVFGEVELYAQLASSELAQELAYFDNFTEIGCALESPEVYTSSLPQLLMLEHQALSGEQRRELESLCLQKGVRLEIVCSGLQLSRFACAA